jgi:hypothetical protein
MGTVSGARNWWDQFSDHVMVRRRDEGSAFHALDDITLGRHKCFKHTFSIASFLHTGEVLINKFACSRISGDQQPPIQNVPLIREPSSLDNQRMTSGMMARENALRAPGTFVGPAWSKKRDILGGNTNLMSVSAQADVQQHSMIQLTNIVRSDGTIQANKRPEMDGGAIDPRNVKRTASAVVHAAFVIDLVAFAMELGLCAAEPLCSYEQGRTDSGNAFITEPRLAAIDSGIDHGRVGTHSPRSGGVTAIKEYWKKSLCRL